MEKQQNWSPRACVFLFLLLALQIHFTSQTYFLNNIHQSKGDIVSKGHANHFIAIRRINMPSLQTTISSVNQQQLKNKDLIKKLPGQPPVSFKQYGGYVAINGSAGPYFYYYFVEAINANNSSPLVIWLNGGPSCSSLNGAFLGHGPFRVHSDGKTLYRNPYSWNNETNVLYIETPAGVGFSYSNNPSDLENLGDKRVAEYNYMFLVKWLDRFSEYKGRDVYITGQSYAGHYCSQLAQLILHNKNQTFINLRGVSIGNPGLDQLVEEKGGFEYMFNHALISPKHWDNYKKNCVNGSNHAQPMDDCFMAMMHIDEQTRPINTYNIYAPACLNSTLTTKPKKYTTVKNFDPCSLEYLTAYLNRGNVQQAMHANTTKLPYSWNKCNNEQKWNSNDMSASVIPILEEVMGNGVRVLVYSGDTDAVVSHTSTMDVLRNMNLTVEKVWHPWFSEGEVGGYTEKYKNNFTYATVRGAGHCVPCDQPNRALTLFTSFIRNTPLPDTL